MGIILDTALSWKYHINMIDKKISKVIGILHKLKYIFPKDILLTIYKSLILPHLNYELLQDISVLQKKAIRVVTNNTYKILSIRICLPVWRDRVRRSLLIRWSCVRALPQDIYVVHCWLINPNKLNLLSWLLAYLSDK